MKVELVNKKMDRDNTLLLTASSSLGEMHFLRFIVPQCRLEEGEERKAFYNVTCFAASGRLVGSLREDNLFGFDYKRIKEEFLSLAKDDSYLQSLIQQRIERDRRK